MGSKRRLLIAMLALVSACSGDPTGPTNDKPLQLRGVVFTRKVVAADSVRLARYGRIVSVVHADSVVVLLTNYPNPTEVVSSPGIAGMCQSLGSDSTARIEVELGVGPMPTDTAVAIVQTVGVVHDIDEHLGIVDGMVPAFRLKELDRFPQISYLYVVICPYFLAGPPYR